MMVSIGHVRCGGACQVTGDCLGYNWYASSSANNSSCHLIKNSSELTVVKNSAYDVYIEISSKFLENLYEYLMKIQ